MRPSKDWVALVVAVGLAVGLDLITFGVLWDALRSDSPGISDNAVQLLTGWGGGLTGIIGAYVGYKASQDQQTLNDHRRNNTEDTDQDQPNNDEEETKP